MNTLLDFSTIDGILHVDFDEPSWARAVSSSTGEVDGPFVPLADPGMTEVSHQVEQAAQQAFLANPLTVDVVSTQGATGLISRIVSDLNSVVSITRAGMSVDGRDLPAPGVLLRYAPASCLATEIMRTVPAEARFRRPPGAAEWVMPDSFVFAWIKAARRRDTDMLNEIAKTCGWGEPPELLVEYAADADGSTTLSMRIANSPRVLLLEWTRSQTGWLALARRDDAIVYTPLTREQIAQRIVASCASAMTSLIEYSTPSGRYENE